MKLQLQSYLPRDNDISAIQHQIGALIHASLNQVIDSLFGLWRNDWTQVGPGLVTSVHCEEDGIAANEELICTEDGN